MYDFLKKEIVRVEVPFKNMCLNALNPADFVFLVC